ncbi:hypothetical protein M569_17606 [Genlisea aurea]|uniref:Protein kinase domain-containing protein n=1 Tax=Genlisea aurea TaxID=192259 RepID=S8BS13_9LAMI|nr:hypothetical protein M569_17606 [Genlisea aurea]
MQESWIPNFRCLLRFHSDFHSDFHNLVVDKEEEQTTQPPPSRATTTPASRREVEVSSNIVPKLRNLTSSEVQKLIPDRKVLGHGGFGFVYQGKMDGQDVAVKILHECGQEEARGFRFEVGILATVYHKNLTRILGYCQEDEGWAIVMELMENGNLKQHLSGVKNLHLLH